MTCEQKIGVNDQVRNLIRFDAIFQVFSRRNIFGIQVKIPSYDQQIFGWFQVNFRPD